MAFGIADSMLPKITRKYVRLSRIYYSMEITQRLSVQKLRWEYMPTEAQLKHTLSVQLDNKP